MYVTVSAGAGGSKRPAQYQARPQLWPTQVFALAPALLWTAGSGRIGLQMRLLPRASPQRRHGSRTLLLPQSAKNERQQW